MENMHTHSRAKRLNSMSNQDIVSSYNINTISSRQVMRLWKSINKDIIS